MTRDAPPLVFTAQSKRYFYCREAVCEFAFARGAVPINPFMVFGFFLSERADRDAIRNANDALVRRCDELWVFGRDLANGVLHEIDVAVKAGKAIRFFSVHDQADRIQELHVDALHFEDEVRARTGYHRERLLDDLKQLLSNSSTIIERSLTFDI